VKAWYALSPSLEDAANAALSMVDQRDGTNFQPPRPLVFRAFEMLPPEKVRVVILGLDPYPTPGHAHGLSFSIPNGVRAAKTFKNIEKEYESDLGYPLGATDFSSWVKEGVLLANSALTVKTGEPKTHLDLWRGFSENWISALARNGGARVWVLWGNDAQEFRPLIEAAGDDKQMIIEAPHPSPLAAWRGFFGSRPFTKVNTMLSGTGAGQIDWRIPAAQEQGTLFM